MPDRDRRYRFLGRAPERDKAPILAEAPGPRLAGGRATLRLYDPIDSWGGWWGVSAKEFAGVLDELPDDVTEIELLINSPGGDVFDGIAIVNALRRHKAKVITVVEGLAASAASLIAVSGDEVVMARNAELMIHDAWSICVGNAEDMAQMADNLGRISDNLASIYAEKAGGEVSAWRAVMRAETWYSAAEAVAAGLADRVDDGAAAEDEPDAQARFDTAELFHYAGRAAAPPPPSAAQADPQPSPAPADESVAPGDTPQEPARATARASSKAAMEAALFEVQSIETAAHAA